jgi:hypothetical protein
MKRLLHCVFRHTAHEPLEACGGEVLVVAGHGLAAAASRVQDGDAVPGVSRLLAYQKVIEAFHASRAVIPMRYGCFLESESAIVRLLEDHREEYETLLCQLEGMAEMGIRVLLKSRQWPPPWEEEVVPSAPGAAYFARLRKRHASRAGLTPDEGRLAEQISSSLCGFYDRLRTEASTAAEGRLLSLYFLTPKTSVGNFRDRVRQMRFPEGTKLLLSGPWPPYNFVSSPAPPRWTGSY